MKKLQVTLIACILSVTAFAQNVGFYYGTRLGLGESTLDGGGIINPQAKLLWQIGGASAFQFTDNIGIMADFLLTGKGAKGSGETEAGGIWGSRKFAYNEKISLLTGDIPIMAKLSYGFAGFYIKAFAGPSVNFNFNGMHSLTYDDADFHNENGFENKEITTLETMSNAFVYGVGFDVKAGDGRLFFLDVRKSTGNENVGTLRNAGFTSGYTAITAGYYFH